VDLVTGKIAEGTQNNLGCILTMHDITKEQELEKMKLDFVSMAAHELRTPITAIKDYLHVFIRNYKTILNTEQVNVLDKISIATTRLVSLVENLLNVTKIEKGTLSIQPQAVDWTEYIRGITSEMSEQARQKQLALIFTTPKINLPKVLVDKIRMGEVVSNLLSNAIIYTPAGGKITVWTENKGREVITHVTDTGIGIPKEALPKLFTKFFRADNARERHPNGTGLGLYIVKSVLDNAGGSIWFTSEENKGATFYVSVPMTGMKTKVDKKKL
jgi:two-component system phosphate regulon sensor histidine kinase PhoR